MAIITVDAMGDQCPISVIKTRKALSEVTGPCTMEVHVDNATAEQNILRLASNMGIDARSTRTERKHFVITMSVRRAITEQNKRCDSRDDCAASAPKRENTVIAIGSAQMGFGSAELGDLLMKGFIYAVSHAETLPRTILFYNSGARLTSFDSPILEDLKAMEQRGVQILTCGTCLDFYEIKNYLSVGAVTNMYQIVEIMNAADKLIQP